MSTLEMPASFALILVMAILVLCLSADRRHHVARSTPRPALAATADTRQLPQCGIDARAAFAVPLAQTAGGAARPC
jgi:hypothetical protein